MINALTIDVEDYYMVSAFADRINPDEWDCHESRVENNTLKILDVLASANIKGTFFILGWVAERFPHLVRKICENGHEVASHGYNHRLIYNLTPEEFREDIRLSRKLLEDITGSAIQGYRAASYSIVRKCVWAFETLIEEGFVYDSSVYPIYHDRYGIPGAKRQPHIIETSVGSIAEFPPATIMIGGHALPVAGGGYLRLLPLSITRRAIRLINEKEKQPAVVYLHPWEIDPDQPRIKGSIISRFRHYINLHTTLPKLQALLSEFRFKPLSEILDIVRPGLDRTVTVSACSKQT